MHTRMSAFAESLAAICANIPKRRRVTDPQWETTMSQTYELRIRIPLEKVATIIEVLKGEGTLLSVNEVHGKRHARRGTARFNGPVTGRQLATDFIKRHKTFTSSALVAAFVADKRNPKSASPI